jgi:hypothetical protein
MLTLSGDEVMTVRHYGRVTPLQMYMLDLGGEVVRWAGATPPTDGDRQTAMKEARDILTRLTGRDFGYDLAAWHGFLLSDNNLSEEYQFDSAWKTVKKRIDQLLDDPDRVRLVRLLNDEQARRSAHC